MKIRPVVFSILYAATLALAPLPAGAEDDPAPPSAPLLAPLLITEVQTRSLGSAYEEFVELHNTTDQIIDFSSGRWQLEITARAASSWDDAAVVALSGMVLPDSTYVVGSKRAGVTYPDGAGSFFDAGLSDDGGHIRLTYSALLHDEEGECTPVRFVVDQVEWSRKTNGTATYPSIDGRGVFLTATTAGIPAGSSLQRQIGETGHYLDHDNDAVDFGIAPPSLLAKNGVSAADPDIAAQPVVSLPEDECMLSDNEPETPEPPDPGGSIVIPPEEDWPPSVIESPASAESETESRPSIPAGNVGLKPPLLSELLPNPASPQTDKNDEFIELYNPNEAYFDLSGYILEVGLTTKRRYTIPAGTKLPPKGFLAFFSAQTKLALSNSGGQVALLDPLGRTLAVSEPYGTAKDGQAWVFASGIWQWTTKPTPNALNVVSAPTVKSKSTTKKSNTATTSATRSGVGAPGGTGSVEDVEEVTTLTATSSTPLHPGVLALIAVSAVLYGAYEYRRDVANRIHQFRANRAARRALRQSVKGG